MIRRARKNRKRGEKKGYKWKESTLFDGFRSPKGEERTERTRTKIAAGDARKVKKRKLRTKPLKNEVWKRKESPALTRKSGRGF